MADNEARKNLYSYKENSNLVLGSTRRKGERNEPSGEAISLRHHMQGRMGDKAIRELPSSKLDKQRKKAADKNKSKKNGFSETKGKNILEAKDIDLNRYVPKTQRTRLAYEDLLYKLSVDFFNNQPENVVTAAANEVIEIFLEEKQTEEKISELCELFAIKSLSRPKFGQLQEMVKKIDDYSTKEQREAAKFEEKVGDFESKNLDMELEINFDELEEDEEKESDDAMSVAISENEQVIDEVQSLVDEEKTDFAPISLEPESIGPFWLQGKLQSVTTDQVQAHELSKKVLETLNESSIKLCENRLVMLLGLEQFELIQELVANREIIYFSTQLKQASDENQRAQLEKEMESKGLSDLYTEITNPVDVSDHRSRKSRKGRQIANDENKLIGIQEIDLKAQIDLVARNMSTDSQLILPANSWQKRFKGYEEVYVPAAEAEIDPSEKLVRIEELPPYCKQAFRSIHSLNRIQSKLYQVALARHYGLETVNMLVCAPTGAGKTNVAMLTILNEIHNFFNPEIGKIDSELLQENLKIIYVAPMKALVQEVVEKYSNILSPYGIVVREMSGDLSLTRREVTETQVIVATPEKLDVISRKKTSYGLLQALNLVIFDEVHLLHNDRGAVIESLVCRLMDMQKVTRTRIVALSATLPNYQDVAQFLHVPEHGLFYFNNTFRPCPLQQIFIGVTEKKAVKALNTMNKICYDKVMHQLNLEKKNQILVFVHSRNDTYNTAKMIIEEATERGELGVLSDPNNVGNQSILNQNCNRKGINIKLGEVLKFGIGLHHAGLTRTDRNSVEEMFLNKNIRVLISTATLAWGVNLPANSVIIKGTQVYNLRAGGYTELSFIDILQMLGRAGRPQFDTFGTGIIITNHRNLQKYLSLINEQFPIESQLIRQLPDVLNAEIVKGTINSLEQGMKWLKMTYLNVRMHKNPSLYGVFVSSSEEKVSHVVDEHQVRLIHSALRELTKSGMIKYSSSGNIVFNDYARIASHFYLSHETMSIFLKEISKIRSDIDILRLFSLSSEFDNISVRAEEKVELKTLAEFLPIPLKDDFEDKSFKVCCLLQCYISKHVLTSFSVKCDLIYIYMSAQRIFRALFEVCLKKRLAITSRKCLDFSNMVSIRLWSCQFFLREVVFEQDRLSKYELESHETLSSETLSKLERIGLRKEQYFALSKIEMIALIEDESTGRKLNRFINAYPKFNFRLSSIPIDSNTLRVTANIAPNFVFNDALYGNKLIFWVFVEDNDGKELLHFEKFTVSKGDVQVSDEGPKFSIQLIFNVLLEQSLLPRNLFVRIKSDVFTQCEYVSVLSLNKLIMPRKHDFFTKVIDLRPTNLLSLFEDPFGLLVTQNELSFLSNEKLEVLRTKLSEGANASISNILRSLHFLRNKSVASNYFDGENLNPLQNQCLSYLLFQNELFISCPTNAGKIFMLEASITGIILKYLKFFLAKKVLHFDNESIKNIEKHLFTRLQNIRVIVVAKTKNDSESLTSRWQESYQKVLGWKIKNLYTDEPQNVVISNGLNICIISAKSFYQNLVGSSTSLDLDLLVFQDFSEISNKRIGSCFEQIALQVKTWRNKQIEPEDITHDQGSRSRLVVFSTCVSNADEVAQCLDIPDENVLSFPITSGVRPPDVHISGFPFLTRAEMGESFKIAVTEAIRSHSGSRALIYLENRVLASSIISELLSMDLIYEKKDLERMLFEHGIGIIDNTNDDTSVQSLEFAFQANKLKLLFVTLNAKQRLDISAPLVIFCEGHIKNKGDIDFEKAKSNETLSTLVSMVDKAHSFDHKPQVYVFTQEKNTSFYQRMAEKPLQLESVLGSQISSFYIPFISRSSISKQECVQIITKTFFYRRLLQNPNFYGLFGRDSADVSEFLSDLVEDSVSDLESNGLITVRDSFHLQITPLGKLTDNYDVNQETVGFFNSCLTKSAKYKSILEVVSCAIEFTDIIGELGEEKLFKDLSYDESCCKLALSSLEFSSVALKVNVLCQAYISQYVLEDKFSLLQSQIVAQVQYLLSVLIDMCVLRTFLKPCLIAIEIKQMIYSRTWKTQSELYQIPLLDKAKVDRLKSAKVETLEDFLNMEDDLRVNLLELPEESLMKVAEFCNEVPDVSLNPPTALPPSVKKNSSISISFTVVLNSFDEEEEMDNTIISPNYYIVVGSEANEQVFGAQKFTVTSAEKEVEVKCIMPNQEGDTQFQAYLMCERYRGIDVLSSFSLYLSA